MTLRLTLLALALGLLTPLALGAVTPQGGSLDAGESLTINDVAVTEGNTGGVTASFTVTMTPASTATVTVDYATADGSATVAGGDYTAVPTTALTFAPGETSKTVDVTVNGDALNEANETFNVDLTNATGGAVIADAQGVGTINDDDPQPSLSITDQTVTEGNAPATVNAGFTVSLSAASGQPVSVQTATANFSAIAPDDYIAVSPPTTLTFNPGETSKTVTVTVKGDALNEANETFHVDLSGATSATIADAQGVGTINDDDPVPSLSISDATVTEGDPPATVNATFNVNLSAASGQQVTVGYSTSNGGATAPADFTAKSGPLTFAAGETTKSIDVTVKGDLLDEPNETFFVTLVTPSHAAISDPQGLGLINDDDPTPTLSINDASVLEGNAGTVTATFTVNLSAASAQTVTVQAATADDSATVAGGDYVAIAPPTTLTFLPGETSKTVTVTVNGDLLNEINETFHVNLSAPSNATILDGQGVGTITDDDAQPTLAITDAPAVTEGNPPATVNASFTVGLSAPSGQVVTVHAATADQSAIAPGDYTAIAPAATVTFNPGETSKTVNVAVNGDLLNEPTETFVVNLASPTNATILDSQGVGTITDDDGLPTLAINDVSVLEGNAGTVGAVFTVNLSAASGLPVTVQAATADNSATVASGDYVAIAPPTTLTFLPGETSKTVTVTVNGDGLPEANETFHVNLSGATNATIADAQGVGTITNDDPLPSLAISDATVTEGNPPATVNMTFTATLSAVSGQTVSAQYATDDRTATVLADYQAANGTVTFAPGETSKTVTVVVNGDSLDEADETFVVDVVDATGATIADPQGQGTILDDDPPSTLAITNATVTEGNAPATVNATFTVGLSAASGQTVTVQAASANQSAIAPGDYTALAPPATVTFNPGETSKTVNVTVKGDALDEDDETFVVNLANATNATILDGQGVGTITDDDPPPTLAVNDVSVTETNAGTVAANFTVSLNTASGRGVAVGYATQDDSATSPADYTTASGTLNFAAGETSKQVAVTVNPDLLDEADETYFVNLSTPSNATVADGTGLGTIIDNDPLPAASINDVTVTEGDAGELEANFTVSLSAASGRGVTVDFTTANVTASTPADYQGTSGALFFSPGQTSRTITVNVHGDLLDEIDETFHVNLSGPTNATIADNQGVGTINDNDPPSSLSINDVTVTEGNAGSVNAVFTVTLAPASGKPVTVGYTTAGGTATTPGDYTAASGTLNFSAGEATKTITVAVVGDLLDEIDETFNVNLSGATNATIADAQGAGTITDDDPLPALSINDVTVTESDTGTVAATFNVSLGSPSGRTVSVNYSTADGSATAPADYAVTSGALTFAAGETTKTATVAVNGDLLDEVDENFLVNLAGAVDATIADGQGLGTVTDNDPLPSLSVNDVTVTEGNTGTVNATFTVTLAPVSGRQATVNYATANGTATAPADFVQKTGTLTFAAGETTKQVTVVVNGDALDEIDESLTLGLSGESNATILDGQGAGTITDDDPLPSLTVNDVAVTEGNAGTVAATFTLTLTPVSGRIVSVDYATANGTAGAGDYQSGSGTVTFAPGETTKQVTVLVNGDTLDETDESFFLNLTNAPSATITDAQGIGTIIDDDGEATLSINDVTVAEGNTGTVNATFTATLSPASGQTVSVGFATGDGSATAPADYLTNGGSLVFSPGQTTQTFSVQVNGDTLDEIDETFTATLSNAVNATIADGLGLGTITDDDPLPALSVNDVTVSEGDAGTTNATFTISLNTPSGRAASVNYATSNGTATVPADYQTTGGMLTFAAGDTSKTVTVPVNGDLLDENNETFFVNLSAATNAVISDDQGLGTITDDDPLPQLSVNDVTITEGDAGSANATFTITLGPVSGRPVTVDYSTANGTATAPGDYGSVSGSLTFAAGETTKQVTVPVNGDVLDEADETFLLNLANVGNAAIADGQGVGTITDDDPLPSLSINDVSVSEGNAGTINATFTASLSAASGRTVTVDYATADGTATQPGDYTTASGSLVFAPGQTTRTLSVVVKGDVLDEIDETYLVNLTSPVNATLADGQGVGTIIDDDGTPSISINDVTVTEGQSGTVNANFAVTLSAASGQTVSVGYATADGTATAGSDYVANGGNLVFAPGQTTRTLTISVTSDMLDELDETFNVNLSDPFNATIADGLGVGTILDDDPPPAASVNDVTVAEGDAGAVAASFTVSLNAASSRIVTVDYATADATATAPADYQTASGTATFAAGQTSQQVTVFVNGDLLDEINETFVVNLANPTNATIGDGQGVGTITDDDPLPALSIDDVSVAEGDSGTTVATFMVSLNAPSGRSLSVNYATADGSATAPADYTAVPATPLTFAAGETSKQVTVLVKGDTLDEADETFRVNLSSPANATIADGQGVATITDNDPPVAISVNDVTVLEGNSGTTNAVFTVSLQQASGQTVTVGYATADGTAAAPGDYTAATGTLSFAAGETTKTVTVLVTGDTLDEAHETFTLNLSNPTNATISDAVGLGTITNDDGQPALSVNDVTVTEGDSGTVNATFTVSLAPVSGQTVSVNYATADGTATAPADYTALPTATLTFLAGQTTKQVTVPIVGDTLDEANETFTLGLSSSVNATIADELGLGTITDNDPLPQLSVTDVTVTEGNFGTVAATFTVSLNGPSGRALSADYSTADGTATAPADYAATSGTLNFAAGETIKQVTVLVNGDTLDEANDTFFLNLGNPTNVAIADGQGVGTITDDDALPVMSVNDVTVTEGNTGTVNATFTVTLSPSSGRTVTADYATANATATAPADYVASSGTLTFAAGETTKDVTVAVNGDVLDELDETFSVNLSNAPNASVADGLGVGTIVDDDAPPSLSVNDVSVTEGNTGTVNAVFTVSLNAPSGRTVTVDYATGDGTATAPGDYASTSGSLTFTAGQTAKTVTVLVKGDTLDEIDETYSFNLSNPSGATVADGQGSGTIIDDDATASISIDDVTVTEGNSGTVNANFTVSLSASSGQSVSVGYATADGTATAGSDYVANGGNLVFNPGQVSKVLTIAVSSDTLDEVDETYTVGLSNPVNATIADGLGLGTILDDDAPPTLAVNDVTVTEGDTGTVAAAFTVSLSAPSGRSLSVDYATADATATAGSDYAAANGTLTFAAGQTSRTVTVQVNGDLLDEANETFLLNLTNPSNVAIADGQGVGTITDNDPLPGLSVNDVTVAEGNTGTVAATFTLSLSAASGRAVSVDYATANGTASAPADYAAATGTVIFAAGETTKTVTVLVNGDTLDESDETLLLNLSNAPNATITDAQGVGTIADDDPLPALSIDDVTVAEGNSGTVNAIFTVSLSQVSGRTVSVGYATADNTATAPADYVAASGTVTFAAGETTKTLTVTVNGDTADEVNETYFVNLSGPVNATLADGQGVGTITDDDGQPTLNVNDVTVTEGDAGTTNAVFSVTLAPASGLPVTVDYATADGTATAPADYTAIPTTTLTFATGETTKQVTVPVKGDLLDEANETFLVNLANASNATIADGLGLGTITDNDPMPGLSVTDVTVTEGNFGTVAATFTVSLSAPSGRALSVDYATADGTATAPADYTAIPTTTLTFAAGETTKQVTVLVKGDTLDEANDTFFLNLTNATNATITDAQGVGTITDDDAMPALTVNDVTVTEGDTGTVAANFTLSLSTGSGRTVTVDYATANGTATAPADYAAASGTATFAPGEITKQVSVLVNGDTLDESDETLLLNLTNAPNATVTDAQGVGTITDDDPTPTISVNDVSVTEGESGTVPASFTVSLSAASGRTITVDYATADNTATAPGDYAVTTGSLTFTPGQTSKTVTVLVKGDALDEIDETYFLNLTNATNAGIADAQGIGTIIDDDVAPQISIADVTVTEGNSGTVNANFAVTLSAASGQTVSVGYATADGTATAGSDYQGSGGNLVFNPGQTSRTLTILVNSDTLDELDETFTVSLSNPIHATIADGLALGTILDDDSAPALSVNDISVSEGDTPGPEAAVAATFTVSLNNASGRAISVDYATADGTAIAPGDYQPASGSLTFAAGQTTKTITVQVLGDTIDEANETFFVNLTNATNATIGDPQGVGTIIDNDPAPNLSVNDVTVTEGDTGTVAANFTVSLSLASGKPVSFDYATANGTATAPGDYQAGSGTVTFAPGETTKTVTVLVNGDRLDEQSETLNLNLANAPNATITDGQGVVTITDDDPQPTVSIADTNVTEGDTGTVNATFTVSLSQASGQTVGVGWATADGTATAPSDYSSASGTVTFAPGETSKTLNVTVKGDTGDEPNETFFVNLSSPSNATIADAQGLGTIIDDDGEPQLSINDVSVTEGNSGTVNANFVVTLSPASGQQVNVGFTTADGTATAGSDYVAQGGNLAFSPGQVSKQVTIAVTSDMFDELDETFTVNLSNPVNAAIGDAVGLGTIIDDDQPPNLSVNDVAVTEGDSGTAAATFNVSLNVASGKAISVDYATGNGTAIAPGDYQAGSGTLTFAAGETTKQVSVLVNGDTLDEANETFLVNLSSPSNAGIGDGLGQGTITDDDLPPTVAINDVTVNEGDSGTVAATFNLSLSGPSGRSLSVAYATANGTATAPGDYSAASGTLSFAAGETTKQVTVLVNGDTLDEMDETFFVNLSAPVNVAIGDGQGAGTITDDDSESRLSIDDVAVTEGNTGTVEAKFTVSIEPASGQTVKVDYATTPGTATPPGDYQTKTGTLTFLPGEAAKQTVTVLVNGDLFNEENETYVVNLASAVNAKIADGQGIGTITDDDGMPTIAVSDATVTEGNSGTVPANFTITLDAPSGRSVTVQYATANDTAQAPSDYQAAGATLTFNPGQTSKPVTVLVNSDALFEATETFFVNLSVPLNATIADGQGIGTITNDDAQAPAPPPPPPPPPPPAPTPPPPPRPVRSANLLSPKNGAKVKSAPLFIWKPAKGARFYNLQIYFKGRQVFTGWPIKARFKLRARWTYKGRKMRLRKGVYTWVVWPAYGRLGGNPRFGKMLGQSSFRYVGK